MRKTHDDFSFEDTDPEGVPLKKSRKFTLTGFFRDIISLVILIVVVYGLYFAGYTYYRYHNMKVNMDQAVILASKTSDDNAIKKYLSSYCVLSKDYYCKPDFITVERNFREATVKMKFRYRFIAFGKYPIIITFHPEAKTSIE